MKIKPLILLLTKLGLGRGIFRKYMINSLKKECNGLIDFERFGIRFRLNIHSNTTDSKILTSSKIYDKQELFFLKECINDGTFIDIGANTGYYTLFLTKYTSCNVIAIEPNPQTLELLKTNIKINDLDDRVYVVSKGISSSESTTLYSSGSLGTASMHQINNLSKSIQIKTDSLLNIINEKKIKKIDAIKIDIEGMEDQALIPFFNEAPKELFPKCIVLEHNHNELWKEDLFKVLKKNNYKFIYQNKSNSMLKLLF